MKLVPDEALAAVAIDSEAEGEPYPAKVAVAEVILRRMEQKFFSDGTLAGTLWRKSQFSAFSLMSEGDRRNLIRAFKSDTDTPAVMDCLKAWAAAKAGSENAPGALLFHGPMATPPLWANPEKFVVQLGKLRFFRP